jgi:hypothetical protein
MTRRKVVGRRTACGQLVRSAGELMSPTEIVRLREAAGVGLKAQIWASQVSRLHLTGKITGRGIGGGDELHRAVGKLRPRLRRASGAALAVA